MSVSTKVLKYTLWSLVPILVLIVAATQFGLPAFAADETASKEIIVQIEIPNITQPCSFNPEKHCIPSLSDYIAGLYSFFAGIIGVLAAVLVLWGGIKWTAAGGNPGKVNDAKETIYSALIAILLIFTSYLLLFTINPDLVKLKLPAVNPIGRIEQLSSLCSNNPKELIDFSGGGCNPFPGNGQGSGKECCGTRYPVRGGGVEEGIQCLWDICNGTDELCLRGDNGEYGCQKVKNICQGMASADTCYSTDAIIQTTKKREFDKKFTLTGCGYHEAATLGGVLTLSGQEDECVWGYLFTAIPPTSFPDGYDTEFVDCFTEEAKDECWEFDENNKKQPKDCTGFNNIRRCRNINAFPRPVVGADGGCLVSNDGTQYKCWNPDGEVEDPKNPPF